MIMQAACFNDNTFTGHDRGCTPEGPLLGAGPAYFPATDPSLDKPKASHQDNGIASS